MDEEDMANCISTKYNSTTNTPLQTDRIFLRTTIGFKNKQLTDSKTVQHSKDSK